MIKFCLEKWEENKDKLHKHFVNMEKIYSLTYIDLVKLVIKYIYKYDYEGVTEIDNGCYQGTLLYMIPEHTYQPSEYQYLMTYVGYGSCSGCDTLYYITDSLIGDKEEQIRELMALSKDIVTNTIKPYNSGWKNDEKFDEVKYE